MHYLVQYLWWIVRSHRRARQENESLRNKLLDHGPKRQNTIPQIPEQASYPDKHNIQSLTHSETNLNESNHSLVIEDVICQIVSDAGIETSHSLSCNDKMSKIWNLISKLTFCLNLMRKIIALFSTVFMVDCKLTGNGHFGPAQAAPSRTAIAVSTTGMGYCRNCNRCVNNRDGLLSLSKLSPKTIVPC